MPDLHNLPDDDRLTDEDFVYVRLTPKQVEWCKTTGRARQQSKDAAGVADRRHSTGKGSEKVHVIGVAAEAALAKALGTKPNPEISVNGTGGVSLEAHGCTFNTTWVSSPNYDLKTMIGKIPPVDVMVLLDGDLPVLRIVGWLPRHEFEERKGRINIGDKGTRWAVRRRRLRPFDQLLTVLGIDLPDPVAETHAKIWHERHATEKAANRSLFE